MTNDHWKNPGDLTTEQKQDANTIIEASRIYDSATKTLCNFPGRRSDILSYQDYPIARVHVRARYVTSGPHRQQSLFEICKVLRGFADELEKSGG